MILEKQLAVSATVNKEIHYIHRSPEAEQTAGSVRDAVKDPGISHLSTLLFIALASVYGQLSFTLWDGCQ